MKIAFWNIQKKDLSDLVRDFILTEEIDTIIFAESSEDVLIEVIKKTKLTGCALNFIPSSKEKLKILTRYNQESFVDKSHLFPSKRWQAHHFKIPGIIEFNLISVHFPSKVNWSDESQALMCVNLARDILMVEQHTKCEHTIVIGDFNMSPFEFGMISANGLHAISDLNYGFSKKQRKVDEEYYKFFYNPMFNFMGDFSTPYGTHYNRVSGLVSHEWHFYDQVIFRPSLKEYLENYPYVKIVEKIDNQSLITELKRPDSKQYSDHLPIILKLKT